MEREGNTELEKPRQSAFTTLHVELERWASVQNRRKHQSWSWGLEGHRGGGAPGRTALHLQLMMSHERISPPLVRSSCNFRSLEKSKISTGENDRGEERRESGERLAGGGE